MPQFDKDHVKLDGGIVVWDGITRPDTIEQGPKQGHPKWTLKVVFPPNCPDLGIYDALARKCLLESEFRGALPQGGLWPLAQVGPAEFGGGFGGWTCISFKTTMRCPDVFDERGVKLDPMQYGQLLYTGQRVDVLAHCYAYNNKSKGVSAGLDGFAIIASANAPRLAIGGPSVDAASAFGGGGAAPAYGAPPAAPAYGAPPAAPAYGAPPAAPAYGAPPAAPAYGAPPAAPVYGAPPAAPAYGAPPAAPAYGAPPAAPAYGAPPAAPAYGAPPAQAHSFLPGQS